MSEHVAVISKYLTVKNTVIFQHIYSRVLCEQKWVRKLHQEKMIN